MFGIMTPTQIGKAVKQEQARLKRQKTKPKRRAKDPYRQIGKSNTLRDIQREAQLPGYRVSKSGRVYYERRKNRSDRYGYVYVGKKGGMV